jgi:hypothetical protein
VSHSRLILVRPQPLQKYERSPTTRILGVVYYIGLSCVNTTTFAYTLHFLQIHNTTVKMATQNGDVKPTPPLLHLAVDRLEVIRKDKLPQEVYDKAVLCLFDYLGALVSGLSAPWSSSLLRYAQGAGSGPSEAWAIGVDSPISAESAAFHNAAIGHRYVVIRKSWFRWSGSMLKFC